MSPAASVLLVVAFLALGSAVLMAMRLLDSETLREAARKRIEKLERKNLRLVERLEQQVALRYLAEGDLVQEQRRHARVVEMLLTELGTNSGQSMLDAVEAVEATRPAVAHAGKHW